MLVDANLLLFSVDSTSPFHGSARAWTAEVMKGPGRVGLPWSVLSAFLRIATHPRVFERPLTPVEAWGAVDGWLGVDVAWSPAPTPRHQEVFRSLVLSHHLRGEIVADAHLAALAIEHGLIVCSADSDFARFPEIRWVNPLNP